MKNKRWKQICFGELKTIVLLFLLLIIAQY